MATREDWQRRLGPLYGGAVALVHSTPWRWPASVGDEARSPLWIVALGAPIGLAAWALAALARAAGLSPSLAAVLGLAMLAAASAALVERGLAARVDDWATGHARTTVATPSLTAVSVVVLGFALILRALAIAPLPPDRWLWVLVATAVVGRWAAVLLQALGDPIDPEPTRSLVATPAPAWLTAALSGGVVVIAVLALGKIGVLAVALAALAAFGLGLEAQRRDRGLSAPVVATAAAVGELLVLLVASIA